MPSLQSQLDSITAQTRSLVQPERLAIADTAIHDLLASGIEANILPVGSRAPGFALPGASATALDPRASGRARLVRSADLLALGPLIIKFFRGRWCPYCITELEAWQMAFPDARARGALLVAISPQLPRQNDFLVQQHAITFPVLSDAGAQLASAFGAAYTVSEPMQQHYRSIMVNLPFLHGPQRSPDGLDSTWRLPLPATVVLDQEGIVLFAEAHADHRVRPDPVDVLNVLARRP